jgi:hypothetical protein
VKLEWIILAEGFGTASNGAVTAIGINQQVIIAPVLPTTTKRGVIAHFVDAGAELGTQELEVTLTVSDPGGRPLLANTVPARMNPVPEWPGIPPGLDIFLEIPLRLSEYGAYEVTLSLRFKEQGSVSGSVPFYVQNAPIVPAS